MKKIRTSILIWDYTGDPPEWNGPVCLWQSFKQCNGDQYSLPAMLESNAESVRKKYLEFIYQFGESKINGKTVIDHLELHKDFSYWWMTLIAQKDIIQFSPHIYDILKLLVAEDLFESLKIDEIVIRSQNEKIVEVFKKWANKKDIKFNSLSNLKVKLKLFFLSVKKTKLFVFSDALFVLIKYVIPRLKFSLSKNNNCQHLKTKISIIDVFTHLDPLSLKSGTFSSKYWTCLVDFLRQEEIPVSWFHWYFRHKSIPGITIAEDHISEFNKNERVQKHFLADRTVSPSQIIRVLRNWVRLNFMAFKIRKARIFFRPTGSNLDLWPILKIDWYRSFFGVQSILNLFFFEQIESFVKKLPFQSLGIYIEENQPWEFALVHYWKLYGHGTLIGVAHTTIPFWDFRYFFDPRTFLPGSKHPPLPEFVAANGPDAIEKLGASGFPKSKIKELEALRYMHLNIDITKAQLLRNRVLRLLVLGDLVPAITNNQLLFLLKCIKEYNVSMSVIFKPHPASKLIPTDLLEGITVSKETMDVELRKCDIVFTNNVTSGAADPYHIGIPVIVQNIGNGINFSPLFSRTGVFFVNSEKEFVIALKKISQMKEFPRTSFFNTNMGIPLWKNFIRENINSN